MFGNEQIESTDSYTYLGVTFEKSGSFNQATQNLKHKALKATFKMLSLLSTTTHINVKLLTKMFDSMIKPIVTYGSEVWASDYLHKVIQLQDKSKVLQHLDNDIRISEPH